MKSRKQEIDESNSVQKEIEKQKFEQKIENEKVISHRIANMNRFQS